jgi:hypothetical protein
VAADSEVTLAVSPPLYEPRMSGQNKLDLGNAAYHKEKPRPKAGLPLKRKEKGLGLLPPD